MSTTEAHCLIIKNFAMLEGVQKEYMEKIGPAIYKEIDKLVENIIKTEQWIGGSDFWGDEDPWLTSTNLKTIENDDTEEFKATYKLTFIKDGKTSNDCDYYYHISPLLGISATQAGFCFEVERTKIGNPKASDWKKFGQAHPLYNELSKRGFIQINNGNWFIPFKLDPNILAEAYATDTIGDALLPIADVLDKIQKAHPLFEQLLSDAEKKYNP